jgi:hypothetical protein
MRSLRRPTRTLTRCLVCGCSEVRTDEVVEGGLVLLGECPRCEHRFTQPLTGARQPARVGPLQADRSRVVAAA